jgi:hypothetical protein
MNSNESIINQEDISVVVENQPINNGHLARNPSFKSEATQENSDQEEDEGLSMAAKALNDFDELCEQVT